MGKPCHHYFSVCFLDHALDLVGKVVGVLIPPILLQLQERRKLAVQQYNSILVKGVIGAPNSCDASFNVGFICPFPIGNAALASYSLRSCRAGAVPFDADWGTFSPGCGSGTTASTAATAPDASAPSITDRRRRRMDPMSTRPMEDVANSLPTAAKPVNEAVLPPRIVDGAR